MNCHRCGTRLLRGECPQCNPHRLSPGDAVLLPDGSRGRIWKTGYYTARLVGGMPTYLAQLRPAQTRSQQHQQLSLLP